MGTWSPTTSSGAPAFNGGTVTSEVIVDTAATTGEALKLTGTRTSQNNVFVIDYPHTDVLIDSDGVFQVSSDDTLGVGFTGTGGTSAALSVSSSPSGDATVVQSGGLFSLASGTTIFQVSSTTKLLFHFTAAPADGTLVAGDCALWFDQTNGAGNTKLMVKGKSADGTVKTASLLLA